MESDDTPPVPFARPKQRGRPASLELPPELGGGFVGSYSLEAPIGQGGHSWTFRARKEGQGDPVALKVLDPQLAREQPEVVERFFREAHTSTSLRHENIVGGYEHGTCPQTGVHFLALEYVQGHSVEDLLAMQGALPEADALAATLGVAQALTCLEAHGVVHRDVKPSNILVDAAGTAKLADFGVAKLLDAGGLTMSGAMVGTPHYIAPEQAVGLDQLDARADLYSLGVTLFRMLTGRFPFEGDGFLDVVTRHVNEDVPDPRTLNPAVTPEAARLVGALAARDPNDRYPTARAAAEDIARMLLGHTVQGVRPRTATHPRPQPPTVHAPAAELLHPGVAPAAQPRTSRFPERTSTPAPPGAPASGVPGHAAGRPSGRSRPPTTVGPRAPAGAAPAPAPVKPTLRLVVKTGNNVLSRKKIDKDVITIGREPRCDVHIDNPMVSRSHCEIRRSGGRVEVIEKANTNGTYVNGERIHRSMELKSGDVVGITKKFDIEVLWDAVAAAQASEPPPPDEQTAAEQTFFEDPGADEDNPYADKRPGPSAGHATPHSGGYPAQPTGGGLGSGAHRLGSGAHRLGSGAHRLSVPPQVPAGYGVAPGTPPPGSFAPSGHPPPGYPSAGPVYGPPAAYAPPAGYAPPAPGYGAPAGYAPPAAYPAQAPIPPTNAYPAPTRAPAGGPARGRVSFSRGGQVQRFVVEEFFQVGRAPECDAKLESSFAPRKAYLIVRGQLDYHLFNVAPYPQTILVNGKPIDDVVALRDGDRITAYGLEVTFELAAE